MVYHSYYDSFYFYVLLSAPSKLRTVKTIKKLIKVELTNLHLNVLILKEICFVFNAGVTRIYDREQEA